MDYAGGAMVAIHARRRFRPGLAANCWHGRWMLIAQAALAAVALPALALFIAALPLRYAQLAGAPAALGPGRWGLPAGLPAAASLLFETFFVAAFCAVAALICWRKPDDGIALLVALF